MRRPSLSAPGLVLLTVLFSNPLNGEESTDLSFDETLYYAYQGKWFDALEQLNTELYARGTVAERDSFWYRAVDENFRVGDLEMNYRLDHRADRIILATLDEAPDEPFHDHAAYRLARLHFRKGQQHEALRALDQISDELPDELRDGVAFLRASIYLALEWSDPAIPVLEELLRSKEYGAFAAYNLGIAYLQGDLTQSAHDQLDRAGRMKSKDEAGAAIRDKANLVLGALFLEDGQQRRALVYLNRVRLDGPFSNRALLSAGWANMSTGQAEKAIVSWDTLAKRDPTDGAVQEAMLALPYAYSQLGLHSQAAGYYSRALNAYTGEFERLTRSVESIRDGLFLDALKKNESRNDEDWVIRLRSLPDAPETYYLMELLASNSFQSGLKNLLDLVDLKHRLSRRSADLTAYEELVTLRKSHYELLLPEIDAQFDELDSRLKRRFEQFSVLRELHTRIASSSEITRTQKARLAELDRDLQALEDSLTLAQNQQDRYLLARWAAADSYTGHVESIENLSGRAEQVIDTVDNLLSRQGLLLEEQALGELTARLRRLESFANKARFGLADSKDRVTRENQE